MDPLTIFTIIVGVVGGVAGIVQIIQYIEQRKGERRTSRPVLTTPSPKFLLPESKDDQGLTHESHLSNSKIISRFHCTREDIAAQVYQKHEPNFSNDILTAFNELNSRKRSRGLEGYYLGQRFRPIMPPQIVANTVRLELAPINYAFVALMKDNEVSMSTKQKVQNEISRYAKRLPRSLISNDQVFNFNNYNLLGIMICLITSDRFTLLRRRGTSVLTGGQKWDVSVSGHPVPDDLRGNFLDVARTVQRETENELGVINGDPRKIVFTGLHLNKTSGDIDLLAYWPIENSAEQVQEMITEKHSDKNARIFRTAKRARESYVWDTDNLLVEFNGALIMQAFAHEGTTIESLLPESVVCLELALIAHNLPSFGLNGI